MISSSSVDLYENVEREGKSSLDLHNTKNYCQIQTPYGLGIVASQPDESTNLTVLDFKNHSPNSTNPVIIAPSKNDTFFDMTASILNQMKPPPPPASSKIPKNQNHYFHDERNIIRSFADRIRSIVLANKKSTVITPTSNRGSKQGYYRFFKKSGSNSNDNSFHFLSEKIIPLPSPAQPLFEGSSDSQNNQLDQLIEKIEVSIPLLSLSPSYTPCKTNIIPQLKEVPMLGDEVVEEENNYSLPPHEEDLSLIGSRIWKFRMQRVLGVGAFAKVYLANSLEDGEHFAVKTINKKRMFHNLRVRSSIEREVGLLKFLKHDKIVQLEATMETEKHFCIVLEYVPGGELFNLVESMHENVQQGGKSSGIDEKLIKKLMLELIEVTIWLHDHNIVHRDIKLENVLLSYDMEGNPHIKLTDFGLARVVDPESPILSTRCGSEEYVAPEIILDVGYDGTKTDTWSIGVLLYAFLVGYLPFNYDVTKGEKMVHLYNRIITAKIIWPKNNSISSEAKEVVERILVRKPEKRILLKEVVNLPWFQNM